MQIEISLRQTRIPLDPQALQPLLEWIAARLVSEAPQFSGGTLSVGLLDPDGMAEVNQTHLGHEGPTDVISFAYDPFPPDTAWSGEVLVNVPLALEIGGGPEGQGAAHELAFYLLHGCHHMMGAEDDTAERKQAMLEQELEWLEEAGALGLLGFPFG